MSKINNNIPKHIAIIMDGNGRWAAQKGLTRIKGHEHGVLAVRKITEYCAKIGIDYLTLFTFSEENWERPKLEVLALMKLLVKSLKEEEKSLINNNVVFNAIGDLKKVDSFTRNKIKHVRDITAKNTGLHLNLAISYGGRQEIVNSVNNILKSGKKVINENEFCSFLYTMNIPDPDLLIRTAGDKRISNFLLWQIAYTEIYFSKVFWPDFNRERLEEAITDFNSRERRYGKLKE